MSRREQSVPTVKERVSDKVIVFRHSERAYRFLAKPGVIEFWVPGKVANPLNGGHGHWRAVAAERKRWRQAVKATYLALPIRNVFPLEYTAPKRVTLTAHTWNRMDSDGLQASLKSVRDGLIDCALIHSDDPASGNIFAYAQTIDRSNRGVTVTVEAL